MENHPFTECKIGTYTVPVKNNLLCFFEDLTTKYGCMPF